MIREETFFNIFQHVNNKQREKRGGHYHMTEEVMKILAGTAYEAYKNDSNLDLIGYMTDLIQPYRINEHSSQLAT